MAHIIKSEWLSIKKYIIKSDIAYNYDIHNQV